MSASHTVSGTAIAKLRSSRFGATACACRLSVVIGTRRFPRGGRMPLSFISLATVRFDIRRPLLKIGVNPGGAVPLPAGLEDLPNLSDKNLTPGGALGSCGGRPPPGMKPAARHAENPAHQTYGMLGHVGGDEGEFRVHVFAAHCAKKAEALRSTSTSSFRRLLSWRSRTSSPASACCRSIGEAEPAASNSSRHVFSCVGVTPSSAATLACVAPGARRRATACSLYSGENRRLVCLVITIPPDRPVLYRPVRDPGATSNRYFHVPPTLT